VSAISFFFSYIHKGMSAKDRISAMIQIEFINKIKFYDKEDEEQTNHISQLVG
jgi:hypothetical protein